MACIVSERKTSSAALVQNRAGHEGIGFAAQGFADEHTLHAWEHSASRTAWLERGSDLFAHPSEHRVSGIDGWFGAAPLHEYNVGAACGGYWSGVKDAEGIPDSRMSDGTPNGYATARFSADGSYALRWHVARGGDAGMHLHAPRVLRAGAYPGAGVYANVYMGEADSRVEYRINGGVWQPMRLSDQPDPALRTQNLLDDAAPGLRGYDRLPEAAKTTHLWRGTLPTDLAPGEQVVEVRAFDRWRGEIRASTSYRLDTASP